MDATKPSNHNNDTMAAPMYITIGPQCCGKTTLVTQLQLGGDHPQQIVDISLDDQPDVYVPVPTNLFCQTPTTTTTMIATEEEYQQRLQLLTTQTYQGKTLLERIQAPETNELRWIIQRLMGRLSPQNFAIHILQQYQQYSNNNSTDVAQLLIQTVEQSLLLATSTNTASIPNTTHVFVLESLFRPHPATHQSAIQRAHQLLRETPSHIPVAWGNTNSKPRDYQQALDIACQTRRPVHFLVCHPHHTSSSSNTTTTTNMPWLPLSTLLQRNLQRWRATGKYVPANAIADCCQRITDMIPATINTMNTTTNTTHDSSLDPLLVSLASPPPTRYQPEPPYTFVMTNQRLILKHQYPPRREQHNQNRNGYNNRNTNGNGNAPTNDRTNRRWNSNNSNTAQQHQSRKRQGSSAPPEPSFYSKPTQRPRLSNPTTNDGDGNTNTNRQRPAYPQQQQSSNYDNHYPRRSTPPYPQQSQSHYRQPTNQNNNTTTTHTNDAWRGPRDTPNRTRGEDSWGSRQGGGWSNGGGGR